MITIMASVFSLSSLVPPPRFCYFKPSSSFHTRNDGCTILTKHQLVSCRANHRQDQETTRERQLEGAKRREILLRLAATTLLSFPTLAVPTAFADNNAGEEDFRTYSDEANKFNILIPKDWQVGAGEPNGFKSITAFYPQDQASSSSVSVVITGLGPDFTRMESFGKVEEFAETLVSGLDRSWQRPPGVAAKLIDSKASKGFYYIEYTLQNPGESRKHLYSAIGMASNGWYNRLYTITGQFVDEESDIYSSKIAKAVKSFKFI